MRLFLSILFILSFFALQAQLPNNAFIDRDSLLTTGKKDLSLSIRSMGFTKNNEYFNRIADGYTIFGAQLNPYLKYSINDVFALDVGFYAQQDLGNPGLKIFEPTITFRANYEGIDILIGTIDGRLNHNLIEPLFDFERILYNSPEQGIQFRRITPSTFIDLWVDWETMIYTGDPKQEEVYGGVSIRKNYDIGDDNHIFVPLQGLVYHKGGAIDSSPDPLQTMMNLAFGVGGKFNLGQVVRYIEPSAYYAYFNDFTVDRQLVYKNGRGWYGNVMLGFNHGIKLMLSYWDANEFISLIGGQLYPSVSSGFKKPYIVQPTRKLLILRFMQDITLGENICLTSRIEPFYDFSRKRIEFSHGIYITFRDRVRLWREK